MKRTIRTELVIETEEITLTCIGPATVPVHCPRCGCELNPELLRSDKVNDSSRRPIYVEADRREVKFRTFAD